MVAFNITGTCANCKMRFRFDAEEVAKLTNVDCPHCGFDFGEEGRTKLIVYAQEVLKRINKESSYE